MIQTIKTILGRELPNYIDGYGVVTPFQGAFRDAGLKTRKAVKLTTVNPYDRKVLDHLDQVFDKLDLKRWHDYIVSSPFKKWRSCLKYGVRRVG